MARLMLWSNRTSSWTMEPGLTFKNCRITKNISHEKNKDTSRSRLRARDARRSRLEYIGASGVPAKNGVPHPARRTRVRSAIGTCSLPGKRFISGAGAYSIGERFDHPCKHTLHRCHSISRQAHHGQPIKSISSELIHKVTRRERSRIQHTFSQKSV